MKEKGRSVNMKLTIEEINQGFLLLIRFRLDATISLVSIRFCLCVEVTTFSPVRAFRVEVSLPDRALLQKLIYALQAGLDQAKQRQVNLPAGVRGHMNRLQPCGFPLVLLLSTKLSTGAYPEPVDR